MFVICRAKEPVCQLFEIFQHEFANLSLPCEGRLTVYVYICRPMHFWPVQRSYTKNRVNHLMYSSIADLTLFELPPILENILIKKLDVPHDFKGEYRWKKLGQAFEIDNNDLTYLEIVYKRSVGSPTKELLEILDKNQCRTVGEVLNKLKGSPVNRPDVARLIRQKWQEI